MAMRYQTKKSVAADRKAGRKGGSTNVGRSGTGGVSNVASVGGVSPTKGVPVTASEKAAAAKRAGSITTRQAGQPVTQSEIASAAKRAATTAPITTPTIYSGGQTTTSKPSYSYAGNVKAGLVPSANAYGQQPTQQQGGMSIGTPQQQNAMNVGANYYATGVTQPYGQASKTLTRTQLNAVAPKPNSIIDKANVYVSKSIKLRFIIVKQQMNLLYENSYRM